MLTAARCITNMQEALPRALPIIMDAVPLLLQKLKHIECIDVAEQSLIALEVMSRRNAKSILAAVICAIEGFVDVEVQGGISSTIAHVDFFSLPSQRLAFQIAANCASFITVNDFHLIRECIADLTQRLNVDVGFSFCNKPYAYARRTSVAWSRSARSSTASLRMFATTLTSCVTWPDQTTIWSRTSSSWYASHCLA